MQVYLFDGLICTDLSITFNGKTKVLKNVAIDTGAVQSILNSAVVEELGIVPSPLDKPVKIRGIGGDMKFFYRKVERVELGGIKFDNVELDFGEIDNKGEIGGLIGLDFLKYIKAVIDVDLPVVYCK